MKLYETLNDRVQFFKNFEKNLMQKLRVASPATITAVDYEKQTLKAQITLREYINGEYLEIPELLDVPFFVLGGGDYSFTFPIKEGDECLVIFGDSCIDSWWQNGDIQNPMDSRRHDLSDGFAIVGFKSQKNKLEDYSEDSFQIRNGEDVPLEITEDTITISNNENEITIEDDKITISNDGNSLITIEGNKITIESSNGEINLKANVVKINDKNFMNHTHTSGQAGSPTGGVNP